MDKIQYLKYKLAQFKVGTKEHAFLKKVLKEQLPKKQQFKLHVAEDSICESCEG